MELGRSSRDIEHNNNIQHLTRDLQCCLSAVSGMSALHEQVRQCEETRGSKVGRKAHHAQRRPILRMLRREQGCSCSSWQLEEGKEMSDDKRA